MKAKRKLAANEIEAYGEELFTVLGKLREDGCVVGSVERMKGNNAGWIVRWFKPQSIGGPAEQMPLI